MESNLSDIMKNALDSMRAAADGDTVLGNPINTAGGVVIIPVSKVSMGFASGGLDSQGTDRADKSKTADASSKSKEKGKSFGGGGGSGVSVTPVAFLVVRPDGDVSLLNIAAEGASKPNAIDSVSSLLNKSPDIIARLKAVFKKDKAPETQPETEVKIEL